MGSGEIMRGRGSYLGTLRLDRPWYNRSKQHPGFPEKGTGEYWYDYKGFYFVRDGTSHGLVIPLESILKVSTGFSHGLLLSRTKILKVVWRTGREKVSSAFVVSHPDQVTQALTATGWA
jgi:hypothetical protein